MKRVGGAGVWWEMVCVCVIVDAMRVEVMRMVVFVGVTCAFSRLQTQFRK